MAKRDYYEILGVTKNANGDELKKAFRKMAIQYHPDKNTGNPEAEIKFKELNEAYQILSDPQKRAAYDQYGHAGVSGAGGFGGFEQGFGGAGFGDIFDNIFGDIFGGGGRGADRGVDLRYNLEITFEEAAFGVEKEISFQKESTCDTCTGTGAKVGSKPIICGTCEGRGQVRMNQGFFTLTRACPSCQGRGQIIKEHCPACQGGGKQRKEQKLKVNVPAGIDSQQKLRLRNEGEAATPGGPPGDLFVVVHIVEHSIFEREGEHVIVDLPVNFVQAALGDEVEVPTLTGPIMLKLKPGTQFGDVMRLRGKGIKRLNGSGHGDQLVKISVETPTKLTGRQKELLREFALESQDGSQPNVSSFMNRFKELFK